MLWNAKISSKVKTHEHLKFFQLFITVSMYFYKDGNLKNKDKNRIVMIEKIWTRKPNVKIHIISCEKAIRTDNKDWSSTSFISKFFQNWKHPKFKMVWMKPIKNPRKYITIICMHNAHSAIPCGISPSNRLHSTFFLKFLTKIP